MRHFSAFLFTFISCLTRFLKDVLLKGLGVLQFRWTDLVIGVPPKQGYHILNQNAPTARVNDFETGAHGI